MSSIKANHLFPSTVFFKESNDLDNEKLIKCIYDEKNNSKEELKVKSNINGYHTFNEALQNLDETQELCKLIVDTINDELIGKWYNRYKIVQDNIINMWGMINKKGASNVYHNHPRVWLSGVYYPKIPSGDCGQICFSDPVQNRAFSMDFTRLVRGNEICFDPQESSLILFPAWLYHYVKPNTTEEDRIAISFNIV